MRYCFDTLAKINIHSVNNGYWYRVENLVYCWLAYHNEKQGLYFVVDLKCASICPTSFSPRCMFYSIIVQCGYYKCKIACYSPCITRNKQN